MASFFESITYTDGIYPIVKATPITNPNRFYAIPLLGMLIKILMLLPVYIMLIFIGIWNVIAVMVINPFVVLFTGKYWANAYSINIGVMKMSAKISSFILGLSDKYPGFDLNDNEYFKADIKIPESPNRFYAIPVIGLLARFIMMIPYFMFASVISQAVGIGTFFLAWVAVLFTGKYPEGIFELARDNVRVSLSGNAYMTGLSDKYPSFYISMANDKIKIILIALALVLAGIRFYNGMHSGDMTPYSNY